MAGVFQHGAHHGVDAQHHVMAAAGLAEGGGVEDGAAGVAAEGDGVQILDLLLQKPGAQDAPEKVDAGAHGADGLLLPDEVVHPVRHQAGLPVVDHQADAAGNQKGGVVVRTDVVEIANPASSHAGRLGEDGALLTRLLGDVVHGGDQHIRRRGGVVTAVLVQGGVGQHGLLDTGAVSQAAACQQNQKLHAASPFPGGKARNIRIPSMAGGFALLHQALFGGQVGVEQAGEDDAQGNNGQPDGLPHQQVAEDGAHNHARGEEKQHPGVGGQLSPVGLVAGMAVAQLLGQTHANLADVVGGEGGGHGDALGLPEGVVLHGGDEVDHHLGDLGGSGLGHKAQRQHRGHLNEHENGVPPDGKTVLDGVGGQFGHKGAQHIGRDGHQVVQTCAPLSGAQGHAHEHHVAGLGVAEHAAPQQVGVRSPEARHGDQGEVDPVPFTGQKILLILLFVARFHVCQPFPSPIWYEFYYTPRKKKMTAAFCTTCGAKRAGKVELGTERRILWPNVQKGTLFAQNGNIVTLKRGIVHTFLLNYGRRRNILFRVKNKAEPQKEVLRCRK